MLASNALIKSLDLIAASQEEDLGSQLTAGGCVTSIHYRHIDKILHINYSDAEDIDRVAQNCSF